MLSLGGLSELTPSEAPPIGQTIDFGAGNTERYYTVPSGLVLPDADWCIGFWARPDQLVAEANGRNVVLQAVGGGTSSLDFYVGPADPFFGGVDDAGNDIGTFDFFYGQLPGNRNDILFIAQRRFNGTDSRIEFYVAPKGSIQTASGGYPPITGQATTLTLGDIYLGRRADGNDFYTWEDPFGEFFILTNDSLSAAEVTALAVGEHITAIRPSPAIDLRFRGINDPEPDLTGKGYDAVQHGAGWTIAPEFFEDGESTTTEAGALVEAASAAAAFSVRVFPAPVNFAAASSAGHALASRSVAPTAFAAAASASNTYSVLVGAAVALVASGNAQSAAGDINMASAMLTAAGNSNALLNAVVQVAASLAAGLSAGDAWAALVATQVQILAAGSAAATFDQENEAAAGGALLANSTAAAAFSSSLAAIASMTGAASAGAALGGVVGVLASILAAANAQAGFSNNQGEARTILAEADAAEALFVYIEATAALMSNLAGVSIFSGSVATAASFIGAGNASAAFSAFIGDFGFVRLASISIVAFVSAIAGLKSLMSASAEIAPLIDNVLYIEPVIDVEAEIVAKINATIEISR